MTNAEGREAFIRDCEAAEHLEPVPLSRNTPVMLGGVLHRVIYDPRLDEMTLITESEWRQQLEKARALRAAGEVRVQLGDGQHARIVSKVGVMVVAWDDTLDRFVMIHVDEATR